MDDATFVVLRSYSYEIWRNAWLKQVQARHKLYILPQGESSKPRIPNEAEVTVRTGGTLYAPC